MRSRTVLLMATKCVTRSAVRRSQSRIRERSVSTAVAFSRPRMPVLRKYASFMCQAYRIGVKQ